MQRKELQCCERVSIRTGWRRTPMQQGIQEAPLLVDAHIFRYHSKSLAAVRMPERYSAIPSNIIAIAATRSHDQPR